MRYLTTFTILVTFITLAGCDGLIEQQNRTSVVVQEWDGPKPWTGKPVLNDPDNFP